jgi:hypothetical protein
MHIKVSRQHSVNKQFSLDPTLLTKVPYKVR